MSSVRSHFFCINSRNHLEVRWQQSDRFFFVDANYFSEARASVFKDVNKADISEIPLKVTFSVRDSLPCLGDAKDIEEGLANRYRQLLKNCGWNENREYLDLSIRTFLLIAHHSKSKLHLGDEETVTFFWYAQEGPIHEDGMAEFSTCYLTSNGWIDSCWVKNVDGLWVVSETLLYGDTEEIAKPYRLFSLSEYEASRREREQGPSLVT